MVVGRDYIAACRVLFLGVGAEGVEAVLLRLATGAVEDKVRVDPRRAPRQLGRGPPADIAGGVGPDDIQPGRLDLLDGGAGLVQAGGAVELVEAVEDWVGGLQEGPPQGDWRAADAVAEGVVDDRPVGRAAQGQAHRLGILDLDQFFAALQLDPLAAIPDLLGVIRVGFLGDQVQIVVLEHGQAPGEVAVMPERGHRIQRLVVAVQLEAGIAQLRLVPHRRYGEADMRVAGQQRLAAGGAAAGNGPGVAALELRQAGIQQRGVAQLGDGIEVLPVAGGQGLAEYTLGVPVEVEDLEVVGAQLIAHMSQQRFGAQGRGEAVGHIAGHAEGVGRGEGARVYAQQVELQRRRTAGLVLVDAIQVGQQRLARRAVHVHLPGVAVGVLADAQGAEQPIGGHQLAAEHLGQFATGQAPQHLHLEQAVLGMHIAQGAVQVRLVLGLDMRHAALVIGHADRRLQRAQVQFAAALWQLAVQVPVSAGGSGGDYQGEGGQAAFHRVSLL